MRIWLGETNRPVYAIGPLVPPGFGDAGLSDIATQMEIDSSKNGGEFQAFLNKTLKSHGERSLIYVDQLLDENSGVLTGPLFLDCIWKLLVAQEE